MKFLTKHFRERQPDERGINMVDLMMWLVIAALLLAAALQGIGFYQRAAWVYQMSTDVNSVGTTATAIAASNSRPVSSADLEEAIASTKLQPGVTISWGTIPTYASGDSGYGLELASAVTAAASVPASANAGTAYALKATHQNVTQKEVVYVFENTSTYKAGASTVPKGSFTINPYYDTPSDSGGSSGSGGSSVTTAGAPVVQKVLGQKITVGWAAVSGASGYIIDIYNSAAGTTVTMNVSGGSTTSATLTLATGFTGTAAIKSITNGVTSAASSPVAIETATNEVTVTSTTSHMFDKAKITGSTGKVSDIVSAPKATSLVSANGRYMATFRTDGDFIVYDLTTGNLFQSTQTATPRTAVKFVFQPDGNLVAYDSQTSTYEAAVKATGTWGIPMPAKMKLEDNGSLKIRDSTGAIKYDSLILNGFLRSP